jgi:three-Cys-motif partner protein
LPISIAISSLHPNLRNGDLLAHPVEHYTFNVGVLGSNPSGIQTLYMSQKRNFVHFCSLHYSLIAKKGMAKDSQKIMLDHSKAKVELYGSYLAKYLNIISRDRYTKRIYIYDLFCGEGIYENNEKGSPVIALETIQKNFGANPYFCPKMKILFNDLDTAKIEKLKTVTSTIQYPEKCSVDFDSSDYQALLPKVNSEIGTYENEKGIVFIDPYGYKEIKLEDIKNLLTSKKTEVLLFLPCQFMFRFANSAVDDDSGGKEHLHKFIKEVFGDNPPEFKNSLDFIDALKMGFKKLLKHYYVDTFTLEREKGQFFALFFFTSHIKGFEKMLETKWELDESQGRGFRFEKSGTLFSLSETDDWEGKLRSFITEGKRYNGEVYEYSLHSGFLPKHTNQILKSWQDEGMLSVHPTQDEKIKKGSFYLNYEKYHALPRKIFFKMN